MGKKVTLSVKQTLFVAYYCISFNATKAAILAGYSKKTAKQIGTENLSKPYLQEAIAVKLREKELKADMTSEELLQQIASIIRFDLTQIMKFNKDGSVFVTGSDELPPEITGAIEQIEVTENTTFDSKGKPHTIVKTKLKAHSKVKGIEIYMRHLQMFRDIIELKGGVSLVMET